LFNRGVKLKGNAVFKHSNVDRKTWKFKAMKALKASSLVLLIIVAASLSTGHVKAEQPTLADQLNTTLNTVNWTSPESLFVPHFGLIFARESNYDAALATIPNFQTLIQMKRIAEIDGFNSSLLNQTVANAMDNQQMTGHWPYTGSNELLVYWRFLVFAYNYAAELGGNMSKWNSTLAYQEYLNCWQHDHDFLWFSPATGATNDFNNRYYDENAEVLSIFLKFYQTGMPEALDYANQMWTHLCESHWSGSYFPYTGNSGQVECEAGHFAEIIAELYAANGYDLPNFPDYILQDLNYKFLSGGNWSGKLWSPGGYVVRHAESNSERRLENTVTAWAAMHSYYTVMNDSMKSNFIKLLTGTPNAWQGIVNNSNLYSDGRFRWRDHLGYPYSDAATCAGAMILFLNGIVPDSGSLAIPVIDEYYQDWYSMFPASNFRFDYESQTIRIPVWAGKLNFIFGTEIASYTFPEDGIYEVQFSPDWNNVTNANKISPLSEQFTYLPPAENQPHPRQTPSPTPSPSPPPYSQPFPLARLSQYPDAKAPTITVVSPKNTTYPDNDILLKFTVSELTSWVSYSVDGGAQVEVSRETTLPRLPDGQHSIVVYASDLSGKVGSSDIVNFTVDTSPPSILLLSPQNQTYTTNELQLDFTLNKTALWAGYSLDGQETVTARGNVSLKGLAYGSHTIIVYAKDAYGNMVASETTHFSVAEPFPTVLAAAALTAAVIAGGAAALLWHFKRSSKAAKKPKLQGQPLPT
jgi:hypothetical protein